MASQNLTDTSIADRSPHLTDFGKSDDPGSSHVSGLNMFQISSQPLLSMALILRYHSSSAVATGYHLPTSKNSAKPRPQLVALPASMTVTSAVSPLLSPSCVFFFLQHPPSRLSHSHRMALHSMPGCSTVPCAPSIFLHCGAFV